MKAKGVFTAIKHNGFIPYDDRAHEILNRMKEGDRVLLTIHRARNPEHNALAHVVFQKIAESIGQPSDVVKLWIKWELGYVDLVCLPSGRHLPVPRSISFAQMGQDEFQKFWDEAWVVIGEKILPQLPQKIFEEIRAIVGRKAA
jgi:Protein of unknown function (DUF1367)